MRSQLAIVRSNSLPILADAINADHRAVEAAKGAGLKHAIAAGHKLIEAQERVKKCGGKWVEWVENNCEFGRSTAAGYMRVARNVQPVAHLTYKNALKAISKPREKPAKPERAKLVDRSSPRKLNRRRSVDLLAAVSDGLREYLKESLPEMTREERAAMAVELHSLIDEYIRVANVNDEAKGHRQ